MKMENPRTGITMNYNDNGAAGTPVIFIHGLSGNYTRWAPVEKLMHGDYRIIDYDLRGHSLSAKDGELDYSFEAHVEDLAGLMDALGLQQAVLVGHSMGGMIAQHFALKYPDRVIKLVLVATAACLTPSVFKRFGASIAAWITCIIPAIIMFAVRRKIMSKPHELFPELENPELACAPKAIAKCFSSIVGMDIRSFVGSIRLPALVIASSVDELVAPPLVKTLADLIPGSQFVSIENKGHYVPLDQPARVAREIEAFI